jgi:ABC-type nitrate/sulfonate/bicarbonate transport system ATPase subunit
LNDAPPAGDAGLLEVRISRKAFSTAAGVLDVLADIAYTLARGEVGAFVGPSGCGKTTMLRIVAGLDRDFEGSIVGVANAKLGVVFHEPRLLPWRTVDENVRLVAPGASGDMLAALFDLFELSSHRSHYPGQLSMGLARRVALARAFAVEPELLILDEPFVSLDEALARRLRSELVVRLERLPVTTLLVTHDVEEAIRLADRIFLLSNRPARIIAHVSIATPRAGRSEAVIQAIKADIGLQAADSQTAATATKGT